MSKYWPDPELNKLVESLNRAGAPEESEPAADRRGEAALQREDVSDDSPLSHLLRELTRGSASDLLLIAGAPPTLRVDGELRPLDTAPLDNDDLRAMFRPYLAERRAEQLRDSGATDFSLRIATGEGGPGRRFRVNLHRQRSGLAAAIRSLPAEVPTFRDLNLPETLAQLVEPRRGLVLVCGPTGSGKSSTLAAMVGEVNRTRARHVVTIEDPVEYEHRNVRSIVEQIEVGRDAPSFASALRAALRQDPDVILVGEMRDLETVSTAITAAETGHLILSTLHTGDAAQAITRIVDVFPAEQQNQIRQQLAISLNAIISQQLLPRSDRPGRVPALELLIANWPIRNHIRTGRLQQLASELTLGKRHGMISLEESLADLVRRGIVSQEEARLRTRRDDELTSLLS
jgi:twitching motility protein PilT